MIDPQRIWTSSQLPTLPTVAVRLLALTRDPEAELAQVAEVIRTDPAISAKLIKAANSSLFGFRYEVKSLERAVNLLGTTVATSLALSFSLTDDALLRGPLRKHYEDYWQESIVQAAAAETLAKKILSQPAEDYFLCGLLQDLGRLAMLKCLGTDYVPALEAADAADTPLCVREAAALGFDHVEIGSKLMEHWKLPDAMIRAAAMHHAPLEELLPSAPPLTLGLALSASVGEYFCTPRKGLALARMQPMAEQGFGLDARGLAGFLEQCEDRIRKMGSVFDVDLTSLVSSADLMMQANEQLAQLAVREHVSNTQATLRQQMTQREKHQLESHNRELRQRALHDPLTGLYNRTIFDESLQQAICRGQREASPVAVLFVDIDHFKQINDTHGHAAGDEVLKGVAQTLQETIRHSDVLARYGGEEFVVLVHRPAEQGLQRLAERVREAVAAATIRAGDANLQVTCSVGAAIALPGRHDENIGSRLMTAADECLYEAKRAGRNRTQFRSLITPEDRELQQLIAAHKFSRWLVNHDWLDRMAVSRALVTCESSRTRLGELGYDAGYLTLEQIDDILREQQAGGDRFGEIALRWRVLDREQLAHLLALQQENPKDLAGAIIRQGLLSPQKVTEALQQYLRSTATVATATA